MPLGYTKNVVLTGFWPPTNEMLRQFSADSDVNPDGWAGENWLGLGFDVYSFFPEFPDDPIEECGQTYYPFGPGSGNFRVDYQDTARDFAQVTETLHPVAVITFSRWYPNFDWRVEGIAMNRTSWRDDCEDPLEPTPSPPDSTLEANATRASTLPIDDIVARVGDAGLGLRAYEGDWGGDFLSEYISYLGVWYQGRNSSTDSSYRCFAAGHVHVGGSITVETAQKATEITVEAVLRHVQRRLRESLTLSVRGIAEQCLGAATPISVVHEVLSDDVGRGLVALRPRLMEIAEDCP